MIAEHAATANNMKKYNDDNLDVIEIKEGEYRVICTPAEVASIGAAGHTVYAQHDCGKSAGFPDEKYVAAGATIVETMEEIYAKCDMVAKVKEFFPCEYPLMREDQIILGCIHPAGHPEEVDAILESKCIAFTAEDAHRFGSPNCEAAGKQGALFGLESMLSINGGNVSLPLIFLLPRGQDPPGKVIFIPLRARLRQPR